MRPKEISGLALRRVIPVLATLAWAGCSGSSNATTPDSGQAATNDMADGSADRLADGSQEASSEGAAGCTGTAPSCFGSDVASCCGQDPSGPATCSGGAWMCGGAAAPGCDGTSCLQPQDGGAGCPVARPTEASACSTSQLACEYGSDPALECDTIVTCQGGSWTTTQTPFTGGFCTTTSASGCPASAADVSQGMACGMLKECYYAQARCECACPSGNPGGACFASGSGGTWQCDTSSGTSSACPAVRPRLGTACSQANQQCSYAGTSSPLACWGDALECRGGVWISVGGAGC